MKRKISQGHKLWELSEKCVVFVNDTYLGSEKEMLQMIQSKFRMSFDKDWYCLAAKDLLNYLNEIFSSYVKKIILTKNHLLIKLILEANGLYYSCYKGTRDRISSF